MKIQLLTMGILYTILLVAAVIPACAFDTVEFWKEPIKLPFDVTVLKNGEEDGVIWQSMVYTSEMRNGEPMRIFAFYARPAAKGKYPAVLSIHGGGGGADLDRAKAFAKAGYACLSYDWNTFNDPKANWKPGDPLPAKPYTVFGNIRYDDWGGQFVMLGPDGKDAVLYRSVIAARRGLTWLSQQREVNSRQLVIEGHSWGGFTAQLLAGIDPRVKATVSSAAAGAWFSRYKDGLEGHTKVLSTWDMYQWSRRYDPASSADRINAPILIRLATADFFGSVDTLADYIDTIPAPRTLELLPCSNHTFGDVETRVAWFDHWIKKGPAFPAISDAVLTKGDNGSWIMRVKASGPAEITRAVVAWTTSPGNWNERSWAERPMVKDGDSWMAAFTPMNVGGKLRVFASVRDANNRVVSIMPLIRDLPKPGAVPVFSKSASVQVARTAAPPTPDSATWTGSKSIGPLANGPEILGQQTAYLDSLWDDQALYLRIRVIDSSPWTERVAGNAWFNGDSIQLRMRTDERAAEKIPAKDQSVIHLGWYPEKGVVHVDAVHGMDFKGVVTDVSPVESTVTIQNGEGYTLFTRIPWSFIDAAFVPKDGRTIRLGMFVNYGDYLTNERTGSVDFNGGGSFNNSDPWGTATLIKE